MGFVGSGLIGNFYTRIGFLLFFVDDDKITRKPGAIEKYSFVNYGLQFSFIKLLKKIQLFSSIVNCVH